MVCRTLACKGYVLEILKKMLQNYWVQKGNIPSGPPQVLVGVVEPCERPCNVLDSRHAQVLPILRREVPCIARVTGLQHAT